MKVQSVRLIPPTGDAVKMEIVFSHETGDITKLMRWGSCEQACGVPMFSGYKLLQVIREAEGDIAFRMFSDDWKKHVAFGPPQDYELRMAAKIAEMCPDLHGADK